MGEMAASGGPTIEESRSLLRLGLAVVGLGALISGSVFLWGITRSDSEEGDGNEGDGDGPPVAGAGLEPLDEATLDDVEPAVQAVTDDLGVPPALWEIDIRPERVTVSVQVPDEPQFVDRYTWREGELSRPAPVELANEDPDALAEDLFDVEAVDVAAVARAFESTPAEHPDHPESELVPNSIHISTYSAQRGDPTPVITVLASSTSTSDDEDGDHDGVTSTADRWVLTFGPDGTPIRASDVGG